MNAEPTCDILVNNLGIYVHQDFFDIPDSEWTRFFEINVMSGVRLARAYMPAMLERNWGRVVFLSSESALNIPSNMIHYGFTKTGVLAIARGLAKRTSGTGVTVNAVLPGPTWSAGVEKSMKESAERSGQVDRGSRRGFCEDEEAVLYYPADGHYRRGRQHGGLRRISTGVGHDRRCVAGGWRSR